MKSTDIIASGFFVLPTLLLLPLLSFGQPAQEKFDSLMRKVPGAGPAIVNIYTPMETTIRELPRQEQIRRVARIIQFLDSVNHDNPATATATALYIKARLQKDILDQPYPALKTIIEASEIAQKNNEDDMLFLCFTQAAHLNKTIGATSEMVRLGEAAIRSYNKLDTRSTPKDTWNAWVIELIATYCAVGEAYCSLGKYDSALHKFTTASALSADLDNPLWITIAGNFESMVYEKTNRIDEAIKIVLVAYRQALLLNGYWDVATYQALHLADLYIQVNNPGSAGRYLDAAAEILGRESPRDEEQIQVMYWQTKSKLEELKGNYLAAFTAQKKYIDMYQALKEKRQVELVSNQLALYEFDQNQRTIEQLENDKKLQNTLFVSSIIVLSMAIILAVYFIYSYRRQSKAARFIGQQRDEITVKNTSLNNALAELKATQEQLLHSEKMSSIGQLTAGLMHEINNPVNFVQSGSEALKENLDILFDIVKEYDKIDESNVQQQVKKIQVMKSNLEFDLLVPEIQGLIKTIRNGSERTASIVSRLQRFSGKNVGEFSEIPIARPIEDTLALIVGELKGRIHVTTKFEPGLHIDGRIIELEQVFMNILMNATQAIKDTGNIDITTSRIDNLVVVSIKDDGPGIPEAIRSKIFDPFFTTKPVGKGMGLGLSITHEIIKGHSGTIEVRNHEGGGAEFLIKFPSRQGGLTFN